MIIAVAVKTVCFSSAFPLKGKDDRVMHWYDSVYEACKHCNGYTAPEALYGPERIIANGCELQHKTFSFVDYRSGREVRLYGIIDRYTPGAEADELVNQLVTDLLPFDRTTDHILNNNPSDREIYCLLDGVLRKVFKIDLNNGNVNPPLYHGNDSQGSPGSSGSSNGSIQINGNFVVPDNGINLSNTVISNQPITEVVAQKLSVMQFLNFYKDIIERVDEAANADEKRHMNSNINQVNLITPPFNPYNMSPMAPVAPLQPLAPLPPLAPPVPQFSYPLGNPYPHVEVASNNNFTYCQPPPAYPPRRKGGATNRKFVARNTTLPPIMESSERWWTDEGECLTHPNQQQNLNLPGNAIMPQSIPQPIPQSVPPPFQLTSATPPIEVARSSNDDQFLHEIERVATDLGFIENYAFKERGETPSVKSEDKGTIVDSLNCGDTSSPFTAAAIVFIFGDKMFVGSIGDSRVILMRQKCHYLDVMYLNEPPLAWYPIAAAKNTCFKGKHYILFQEPIIRGGFLINDYSIFLLMFNEGVVTNMLNLNDRHRTSNEINRTAVQMVIKILAKYPSGDIAQKFVAHIKHSCNRKYKPITVLGGVRREAMSFLYVDLRPLVETLKNAKEYDSKEYDHIMKICEPQLNVSEPKVESHPKLKEYSSPLEVDEETVKNATSMNKVYDMFQEIFEREERERRLMESISNISEDTWVFLRSDQN
uniref:PPM-type phosphatase domain-containing protein n=2 Tax=Wuchereria bancrofti TaxID=6293 RepID=A0A1I8EF14_WUCBA